MNTISVGVGAIILVAATSGFTHRLDEYLQATTIAVEKDRVRTELRLTPGVEVFPAILAAIDKDRNGIFSAAEQGAYATRVQRDLSLSVDGDRLRLRLVSSTVPTIQEMTHGLGAIALVFESDVSRAGGERKLVFENRHMSGIAVYLVNGLVPTDPDIRAGAQRRNRQQSHYELDYVQTGATFIALAPAQSNLAPGWLWLATISALASLATLRQRSVSNSRVYQSAEQEQSAEN